MSDANKKSASDLGRGFEQGRPTIIGASGQPTGKWGLIMLAFTFISPILVSLFAYNYWRPQGQVNHGELLEVKPVPAMAMTDGNGKNAAFADFQGKWLLVTVDHGVCHEVCQRKLYVMRQVSVAQGKDQERIERIWLVDQGAPRTEIGQGDIALRILRVDQTPAFPGDRSVYPYIYLVDPRGNMVLRYNLESQPAKIIKDLVRLLKVSQIG